MNQPMTPDSEEMLDEADDESFPASDPPAWTGLHAGAPVDGAGSQAPHASPTLRHVRVKHGAVAEVVLRLESALQAAHIKVFVRIDHAEEARSAGFVMRPTVVILFGNPKAGTPLMLAAPTVAIDLPLKALVWEDGHGAVWLTYNTTTLLVERHALAAELAARLNGVGELLERVANAVE